MAGKSRKGGSVKKVFHEKNHLEHATRREAGVAKHQKERGRVPSYGDRIEKGPASKEN